MLNSEQIDENVKHQTVHFEDYIVQQIINFTF